MFIYGCLWGCSCVCSFVFVGLHTLDKSERCKNTHTRTISKVGSCIYTIHFKSIRITLTDSILQNLFTLVAKIKECDILRELWVDTREHCWVESCACQGEYNCEQSLDGKYCARSSRQGQRNVNPNGRNDDDMIDVMVQNVI